jgi:hypothetical protein
VRSFSSSGVSLWVSLSLNRPLPLTWPPGMSVAPQEHLLAPRMLRACTLWLLDYTEALVQEIYWVSVHVSAHALCVSSTRAWCLSTGRCHWRGRQGRASRICWRRGCFASTHCGCVTTAKRHFRREMWRGDGLELAHMLCSLSRVASSQSDPSLRGAQRLAKRCKSSTSEEDADVESHCKEHKKAERGRLRRPVATGHLWKEEFTRT